MLLDFFSTEGILKQQKMKVSFHFSNVWSSVLVSDEWINSKLYHVDLRASHSYGRLSLTNRRRKSQVASLTNRPWVLSSTLDLNLNGCHVFSLGAPPFKITSTIPGASDQISRWTFLSAQGRSEIKRVKLKMQPMLTSLTLHWFPTNLICRFFEMVGSMEYDQEEGFAKS